MHDHPKKARLKPDPNSSLVSESYKEQETIDNGYPNRQKKYPNRQDIIDDPQLDAPSTYCEPCEEEEDEDNLPLVAAFTSNTDASQHYDLLQSCLGSLADLKARIVKDFHRTCNATSGDSTAANVEVAFDTCAEYTNYVRKEFVEQHFPTAPKFHVELGKVGGSLGGTQPRDTGIHLLISTVDYLQHQHEWRLEFIILDKLPYDIFIGSTALKTTMKDFFFDANNWSDDLYIAHEFDDAGEADEDDLPPPGLFPDDYFNALNVLDLREEIRKVVSEEMNASHPEVIALMMTYHSTFINDYKGLNIDPIPMIWADDTPDVLKTYTQRYHPDLTAKAEQEYFHLLDIGFVRHSKSNFRSPMMVAPKKTKPFVRLCGNYKRANAYLCNRGIKIPIPRDEINKCLGFIIFAELDWTNAYHQIRLTAKDSSRLALQTIWGVVEPLFLWEGIKSASDLMEICKNITFDFEDFADWIVALYDNILILAHSFEDLIAKLTRVLDRCRHFNLVLKIEKSKIGVREIEFFGYKISNGTLTMCDARKEPILRMPPPCSLTKMRTFLGMCNAFSSFCTNYSMTLVPLYDTTKQTFEWPPANTPIENSSVWTGPDGDIRTTSFNTMKTMVANALIMHFPDYALDWTYRCDASEKAIACSIIQHRPRSDNAPTTPLTPLPAIMSMDSKVSTLILPATEEIIFVYNHVLTETAQRWDIHKKEAYAIVCGILHFQAVLWGKPFVIETDHRNLIYMEENTSNIVKRWMHALAEFQYIIRHIPGPTNILADAMSRLYCFLGTFASIDLKTLFDYHHCDEKGHYAVDETLRRMQRAGIPITHDQAHELCAECAWCQMTANRPRIITAAPTKIIATTDINQVIGMDGLGPYTFGDKNYYIITAVDQFDKFPTLYLATDKTPESYLKALIQLIANTDIFERLHTDRGSDFTSHLAKAAAEFYKINHLLTPVGRPQGSGAEGCNKQINRLLSAILSKYRDSCLGLLPEYIKLVEFILRTHISHETGSSPFESRFGRTARFPRVWEEQALNPDNAERHLSAVQLMFRQINDAIVEHKTAVQATRKSTAPIQLSINSYVKLLPLEKPSHGKTFYSGPFLVTNIDKHNNVTCRSVVTGNSTTYHPERLVPFIGSAEQALQAGALASQEHVIASILTHRGSPTHRSAMEFKVTWRGFSSEHDSWLPFMSVKDNTFFPSYCMRVQLYSLLKTVKLSTLETSALNKTKITCVKPPATIYVHIRHWSQDNAWYDSLQLPDMSNHDYMVLGNILQLTNKERSAIIAFPIFNERYTISHSTLAGYAYETALSDKHILITSDVLQQFPQLLAPDANSNQDVHYR